MEENKDNDIIYDLEQAEITEVQTPQSPDDSENFENSENPDNFENPENPENSKNSENSENSENADNPDNSDCASGAAVRMTAPHEEIERMVEEMGAETLLEIIRDNRNAAIRQIISEVEASQIRTPPSGNRCTAPCSSIFDLAALA